MAAVAAQAVVQAILAERGDGYELMGHRSEETNVRPKLGGPFTNIQLHKIGKEH